MQEILKQVKNLFTRKSEPDSSAFNSEPKPIYQAEIVLDPQIRTAENFEKAFISKFPESPLSEALSNAKNGQYLFRCFMRGTDSEMLGFDNIHEHGMEKNVEGYFWVGGAPWYSYFLPEGRDIAKYSYMCIYRNLPYRRVPDISKMNIQGERRGYPVIAKRGGLELPLTQFGQRTDLPSLRDLLIGIIKVKWQSPDE